MKTIIVITYIVMSFTLSANEFITLQSPVGGERYNLTDTIRIDYITEDVDTLKLEYFNVKDSKWYIINDEIISNKGKNNYFWESPDLKENMFCHIRLSGRNSTTRSKNFVKFTPKPKAKKNIEVEDKLVGLDNSRTILLPNPATTQLSIESKFQYKQLKLYDLNGLEYDFSIKDNVINISHLVSGVYLVALINESQTQIVKFIKQ